MRVYLAGPITGKSYGVATGWRDYATERLGVYGIVALSPMRWKAWLRTAEELRDSYEQDVMTRGKAIVTRDRFDVLRADVILVNVLGAVSVSIGTVLEIAWADSHRIPVVLVIEEKQNPHEHAMLTELCAFLVETLDAGIQVCRALLCNESPGATP